MFGAHVRPAETVESADWIASSRLGDWGTLGALVPNHYESYRLVEPAPAGIEDWWGAQREVIAAIASVGARHTTTPDCVWFGIWEGHGFENRGTEGQLATLPRFALPHRTYYLLSGHASAATAIEEPGGSGRWRPPDLWWPDDRSWFVATDVDFWCNYVAGSVGFTSEVTAEVPTPAHSVTLLQVLEPED